MNSLLDAKQKFTGTGLSEQALAKRARGRLALDTRAPAAILPGWAIRDHLPDLRRSTLHPTPARQKAGWRRMNGRTALPLFGASVIHPISSTFRHADRQMSTSPLRTTGITKWSGMRSAFVQDCLGENVQPCQCQIWLAVLSVCTALQYFRAVAR